ncbi:hypothetical protein V2W45_1452573 [Cenococcum geophilum]
MAPTSDLFNPGPVSLILCPPISLTLYYRHYCPKFSSSSLECGALNYQIVAYYLALLTISIWIRTATVTAIG